MQALNIGSPTKSRGKRFSRTPRELVAEASQELAFGPAHAPVGLGQDGGDTRPATPVPDPSQAMSQRSTLSRNVSQDEHELFLQSIVKNPGAFIVKHEKAGMPGFLTFLKKKGFTATVLCSVDEDAELVAIGKDAQLVRHVGRIGATQTKAVDEACDQQAQRGGFPALVACTGAGVAVGAVATWTGLAFG